MKVVLKKEVCGSREQYTGPIGKPSQLQKVRNALQKKKKKRKRKHRRGKSYIQTCT